MNIQRDDISIFVFQGQIYIQYRVVKKTISAIKVTGRGLSFVMIKRTKLEKRGTQLVPADRWPDFIGKICATAITKKVDVRIRKVLGQIFSHVCHGEGGEGSTPGSPVQAPAEPPGSEVTTQAGVSS